MNAATGQTQETSERPDPCASLAGRPVWGNGLALVYARERKFEAARKELAMGMKISPFFRHPDEIVHLFREHPDWQELLN
jgi:hypothetical protein